MSEPQLAAWADLYWLPLGAGGRWVRWNGRLYERLVALRERRRARDLYHSALLLHQDAITYAVEMGPVWNVAEADRGVVCQGPVGLRRLGRFRAFRYEVRCWPGGRIPDVAEAVDSPQRLSDDPARVADLLRAFSQVPPLTWGRDEMRAGEMWNSNSVISWALARTRQDMTRIGPPAGGRAPGWKAGLVLADRSPGVLPAPDRGPTWPDPHVGVLRDPHDGHRR